jgi:hypothetical protein
VRLSTVNDIATVAKAESLGAIVKSYTTDISSAVVPGWTPGATYYFNVIVKDEAGNKSIYTTVGATMPIVDTTAPVPGNFGLMTSNANTSSATLGWTKATDNISLQSSLQYEVRRSSANNIDSVTNAEANGVVVRNYGADLAAATISGLNSSTTYYFNVIVRDAVGNRAVYATKSVTTTAPQDTTPPVTGNFGIISAANITSSGVTLNWTKATDGVTAQPQLSYEVRRSNSNNIDTVGGAETFGVIAQSYALDLSSANVTGLSAGTTYYFNIIVKDGSGNKAAYVTKSVTTATDADTTAPIPGGGGGITTSSVGASTVTLNWTKASDNLSTQSQLMYEVRRSSSNNIDTILHSDAYGAIAQSYTADTGAATITGLSPSTTYYFNVIVKDTAGNRSIYAMKDVTTAATVDTTSPTPGNSGTILTSSILMNGATLMWAKATDNVTTPSELLYEVRRSSSNNIDTVARAEANGAIVQPYRQDVAAADVSGLSQNTNYYFNVIVKDAAGNKAAYLMVNVRTVGDAVPPVPGGSGLMTSTTNQTSITLAWTKATDNSSVPSALRYEVRMSNSNNIGTVTNAEANGAIVSPYTTDASSATINGLSTGVDYYLNVIVKDEANNKAVYQVKVETAGGRKITQFTSNGRNPARRADDPTTSLVSGSSDVTPPVPGGSGLVTMSGVSTNGLTLRWTTAVDDTSPKAALQYEVIQSAGQNINTVAEAEANGTVIQAFVADTSSYVVKGLKSALQYYYTVVVKDDAGNKAVYATAGDLSDAYSFGANGGASRKTVSALSSPLKIGQVQVSPVQGTVAPAGLAILKASSANGVVSTTAMPLSGGIRSGTLYANLTDATDVSDGLKTGISLANPSATDVQVSFVFADANGIEIKSGVYTLLANRQMSAFLDESPFNGPSSFKGTFTFSSSAPISASGTRTITHTSGEFELQSLPVALGGATNNQLLPLFVDGQGWSTEVVLMNKSTSTQSGTVQFWGQKTAEASASVLEMTINGATATTFNYSIPPNAIARLVTSGTETSSRLGSIRISSNASSASGGPEALAIVSSKNGGTVLSEASFLALPTGTSFRSFVESSTSPWVSSSVSIANPTYVPNTVFLELSGLDGTQVGWTSVTVPPNGVIAQYLTDLFPGLRDGFQGLLRVTSSDPLGLVTLRCMYNAAGRFMMTSTPALNESVAAPTTALSFPMVASGAGYDTQFVLFGRSGQAGEGEILVLSKDGIAQTTSSIGIVR